MTERPRKIKLERLAGSVNMLNSPRAMS